MRPSLLTLLGLSLLAHPLYLEEEPPELRSARNVLVRFGEAGGRQAGNSRSAEEALARAEQAERELRAGRPFEQVAARWSDDVNARDGAVLGSFAAGMLSPALDGFLFSAEVGEVSSPLSVEGAYQVLERVETHAAVRQILFSGPGAQERAARVRAALGRGESFATLAREQSDDRTSATRDGALSIYERGRRDRLLKRAAFALRIGEISGPIESPLGLHVLQRVPLEELERSLRESNWARGRAILLRHELSEAFAEPSERSPEAARALAERLRERILAGEDMAELAREFDDDVGGRERAGDLGWLHRHAPTLAPVLDQVFLLAPGELSEVHATPVGMLLLRRER